MPGTIEALYRQASDHLSAGRLQQAAAAGAQLLRLAPDHAGGLHLAGFLRLQANDPQQALPLLERACERDRGNATALFHLGVAYVRCARIPDARAALERAIALQPRWLDARASLADALEQAGDDRAAVDAYRKLIELAPKNSAYRMRLGNCHLRLGDHSAAIDAYRAATAIDPQRPEAWFNLSLALRDADRTVEAHDAVARALALRPQYPAALLNLGILDEHDGDIGGAVGAYRKVLAFAPQCAPAYWSLANLKSVRFTDDEGAAMRALATSGAGSDDDRTQLYFALAKDCDDKRRYDEAWAYLTQGNALKRRTTPYSRAFVDEQLAGVRRTFDAAFLGARAGPRAEETGPIFIVGMPRSGSSLVEQILASHSRVAGGGELPTAQQIAHVDIPRRHGKPFYDAAREMAPAAFGEWAALYRARNAALADSRARFTDKTPDNFILIGLLRLMFPQATFVHARRHPLDTCLSCYQQLFAQTQSFSYDLSDLAHYYRRYRELMAWWHAQLPGAILDVDYEQLVDDLEREARRIVAFCGLEWEAQCVDFHRTRRAVKTASAAQVRQPLYASSVQRWKHYETQLRPLVEALADFL